LLAKLAQVLLARDAIPDSLGTFAAGYEGHPPFAVSVRKGVTRIDEVVPQRVEHLGEALFETSHRVIVLIRGHGISRQVKMIVCPRLCRGSD
jgi:hypothetical protein